MKKSILMLAFGFMATVGMSQTAETPAAEKTGKSCAKGSPSCCMHASSAKSCDKGETAAKKDDADATAPRATISATEPKPAKSQAKESKNSAL